VLRLLPSPKQRGKNTETTPLFLPKKREEGKKGGEAFRPDRPRPSLRAERPKGRKNAPTATRERKQGSDCSRKKGSPAGPCRLTNTSGQRFPNFAMSSISEKKKREKGKEITEKEEPLSGPLRIRAAAKKKTGENQGRKGLASRTPSRKKKGADDG